MAIYLVSITDGYIIINKPKKWPPPFHCAKVYHILQYILILQSPPLMDILYWFMMFGCSIFTLHFSRWQQCLTCWIDCLPVKVEITFTTFIIFPTYCSDDRGHISNHIWRFTLLFIQFYHISQWTIFHSVCSHCSCCSNSHCTQVPQQSCPCKNNCPWHCDNWSS